MIKYVFTKQFLGFAAAGGFAAFTNWLSRIALSLWLPFTLSILLAYIIGMATAFTLNRIFVFKESEKTISEQAKGFIFMNALSFPVVWFSAIKINETLQAFGYKSYSEAIAHAVAVMLPMITTFLFYKVVAFRDIADKK